MSFLNAMAACLKKVPANQSAVAHLIQRFIPFLLALLLGGLIPLAHTAELSIRSGVVVKFGADAGMVVQERLRTAAGVSFTSLADDSLGGQSQSSSGTPGTGDWAGLSLSAFVGVGDISLNNLSIKFAQTALQTEKQNHQISGLNLQQNNTGILVKGGGTFI